MFNSQTVITEHISEADLKAYFVGFDSGLYNYKKLVSVLMSAIVDFSHGLHSGILEKYTDEEIKEAAKSIYKIESFSEVKWTYVDNDDELDEEDLKNQKKYLNRGEFGELILHVLLRDFLNTIPLLSKIYFKDTDGAVVHGFDAVHIGKEIAGEEDSIFFGETKFYSRKNDTAGEAGIKDLVDDVKQHFKRNFLEREFSLIGKKEYSYKPFEEYEDKNTYKEYESFLREKRKWYRRLENAEKGNEPLDKFLKSVTVPLLCTYESEFLAKYTDVTDPDFLKEYNSEMRLLQKSFKDKINNIEIEFGEPVRTDLNLVLFLFPIPSKKELVKRLHQKLYHRANI